MKPPFTLKLLRPFHRIFDLSGVPFDELTQILTVKFTLSRRQPNTMQLGGNKKKKSDGTSKENPIAQHLTFSFLGLILVPMTLVSKSIYLSILLYMAIILFLFMSSLIADYSTVLLDTRDQTIILTRPVHPKTLSTARLIHIISYLFVMLMELTLPVTVTVFIRFGLLNGIFFMIANVLMLLFTITLTALMYFLLLRFFDGERLKDFINMFQILLTVVLTIGYQLIPRLGMVTALTGTEVKPALWHLLFPPAWFAAVTDYSSSGIITTLLRTIGFAAPILLIVLYGRWIAPNFEKYLNRLNASSNAQKNRGTLINRLLNKLIDLIAVNDTESAYIQLSHNLLTKERATKLRLYPNMVLALIFPMIFFLTGIFEGEMVFEGNEGFLAGFLMTVLLLSANVIQIQFSESYQGAWIFGITSAKDQVLVIKGAVKGYFLACYLPVYLVLIFLFLWVMGPVGLAYLAVNIAGAIATLALNILMQNNDYPFSKAYDVSSMKSGQLARVFINLFILGIFAGFHFLMAWFNNSFASVCLALLSLLIAYGIWIITFRRKAKVITQN